jgi:prolyl oligopeptidase
LTLLLTGSALAVPTYPPSAVDVVRDTLYGVVIEDPYRWLEDQDSPETRAWIEAQNRYRESLMESAPGLTGIEARLAALLKVESLDVPTERGGRYFYSRREADQDQRVLVVRQGREGREEVLLDPHPLSADHTTSVLYLDVSPDGRLAAVGTRLGGADEVEVSFRDVDSKQDLPDRLPTARYFGVGIQADRSGVFYSKHTAEGPRVFHHTLGSDPAQDRLLFGKGYGPEKIVDMELSGDGRWLLLTVYHGSAGDHCELWVKDIRAGGPVIPIVNDIRAFFTGAFAGDTLFVRTNWQAPRRRILRVDLRDPARENWVEVVPEGTGVIESMEPAGGRLLANVLEDVASKLRLFDADGRLQGEIDFPTPGSARDMEGGWTSPEVFFSFESFVVPPTIFRYDAVTGERSAWWRSPAPVESDRFETKQVWYASEDGTRVPMFLVHSKDLELDGGNPVYLTGYGGFSVSRTPRYSVIATSWVENGGVYAYPSLRGGAEFGEAWHRAGMLERKQNVFDDFLAAAEWLTRAGYTSPSKLAIRGGSNGGLLVGAALVQRPELFRAVICSMPLLDMLRYQEFLVARYWVPEYGSAEDPEQFPYLRAYSPYHNVQPGTEYPAVLFRTGDSDTRVAPLHARKMTALLQASTGSDRPVLLHYDTKAGHSRGRPVSKTIEDYAVELQFLFWQLGMEPPALPPGTAR